jgi:cysteinylglycine-S-conjugate dipeptidase
VLCYAHPGVGTGVGGTIPFVEPFARAFAGAPALLLGVEDPDSHTHDVDESLHLADGRAACLAEACLFAELASVGRPTGAGGPR